MGADHVGAKAPGQTGGPVFDHYRGQAAGIAGIAEQAGVPQLAGSSLKAALDLDWDDPAAREAALAEVLGLMDQVEAFIAGLAGAEAAAEAVAAARQVRDQDVDCSGPAPALRRGVARDRRISIEDSQMRHGRKSRSVLFDGYKRHVMRDLDTGLVPAVGITPANAPEASVTSDIAADRAARAPAHPRRAHRTARTRRRRARPGPRRALAGPPRPLPGHPQEPVRPAPRRRRPQPPHHRPSIRYRRSPASRLTAT